MKVYGTGAFKPMTPEQVMRIARQLGIRLVKIVGGREYVMSSQDAGKIRTHLQNKKRGKTK